MTPDEFGQLIDRIAEQGGHVSFAHRNGIGVHTSEAELARLKVRAKAEHHRLLKLLAGYKRSCEAYRAKHKIAAQELANLREARK
jgi:hypothetical protein